jgi:S1-C subfamily serine protease
MPSPLSATLAVTAVSLLAACSSAPRGASHADHPLDGVHVVAENPGDCPICALYETRRDAVVLIRTDGGLGTGVVIDDQGTILTNAHVVGDAASVSIETASGTLVQGTVGRKAVEVDLAVITVHAADVRWTAVRPDEGASPVIGSDVYVIGHPAGLGWTLTTGILSGERRMRRSDGPELFQITAAVSPGNSGGPAFDSQGRWIGTVSSKLVGPGLENISFVIPSTELRRFLAAE